MDFVDDGEGGGGSPHTIYVFRLFYDCFRGGGKEQTAEKAAQTALTNWISFFRNAGYHPIGKGCGVCRGSICAILRRSRRRFTDSYFRAWPKYRSY